MQKIILSLLFVSLICVTESYSQNIKNLAMRWTLSEIFSSSEGSLQEQRTEIVTDKHTLEWKNEDGSLRETFQIKKVKGEWTDVRNDGILQYEVTSKLGNAIVSILRANNEIKIVIAYISTDDPSVIELPVESYTELKVVKR